MSNKTTSDYNRNNRDGQRIKSAKGNFAEEEGRQMSEGRTKAQTSSSNRILTTHALELLVCC